MEHKGARILIVDDEDQVRRLLHVALEAHGYETELVDCGLEALRLTTVFKPDLWLLDMSLPDLDGLDIVKKVRQWSKVPIIILSVRESEADKVGALDAGADDYVTKPFNMAELLARIRAALRHALRGEAEPIVKLGDLSIDLANRQVMVGDQEVRLTPTEYELLKTLAIHAGKILTQRQLLQLVWGPGYEGYAHYLRIYVRHLRHKIEIDPGRPRHIITEPGVGFRLL